MARMRKYGESKMTRIMMATVPHVTSGLRLRKFQADGFLLTRVYIMVLNNTPERWASSVTQSQPFFLPGLCTQTSISICDPKGSHPAEGRNVSHFRVHSVLNSTLCTLTRTLHPSAEQNPFGSQMFVCTAPKNGCDCVTEEAHHFGVLFVHQYVHILGDV